MDLFTWNDMNEPSVFNGPEVCAMISGCVQFDVLAVKCYYS